MSASLDTAIACYQGGRVQEARRLARAVVAAAPSNGTAWSLLGYLERDLDDAAAAAAAFDRALALFPRDPTALSGRARMALERTEEDAVRRYEEALRALPGDPQLVLGLTEARLSLGDMAAIDGFREVVARAPQWIDGQVALARFLWEYRRDEKFADHLRALLRQRPMQPELWGELVGLLSGSEHFEAAADAARDARQALGQPQWALLEAIHAGRSGNVTRAGGLLASLPAGMAGAALHRAIHAIRTGELELARRLIEEAIREDPSDISAWGTAELVFRKLGDERAAWLSGRAELIRTCDLGLAPDQLERIREIIAGLLRTGVQMVDQSVRQGTQTRWRLFDRPEPELAELKQATESALADYIAALPPADPDHPLLRHRDAPLAIAGNWAVRLTGGGYHVSHIHPYGLISSACHLVVPAEAVDSDEGALELGRPSDDLKLDLEPIRVVRPRPGHLTLFPSFLHHGTRRFGAGERMTVAFDVKRRRE